MNNGDLIERISIPSDLRKQTTLASANFYDLIEIYYNKVSGYKNGAVFQTWYFKDYKGIDTIEANLNSQFAQVVFLTGINSNNRFIGADLYSVQNRMAMQDTNRILLCGGMFSYSSANTLARSIGNKIRSALEEYKNQEDNERISNNIAVSSVSVADELLKLKRLYDMGVLTKEEFNTQKKILLSNNTTQLHNSATVVSDPLSESSTWRCPNCGKKLPSYTTTCKCGEPKPFSYESTDTPSIKHPKPEKSIVSDVPVPTSTTRYKQCPNCGGNCLNSSTKCKHCGCTF